ncbi:MAG TPA: hypothetical protein VHN80_32160, partial [Kineosporiaceae bacterium]|nr:hypothetical protein [Kineosporiaceae bacterium]
MRALQWLADRDRDFVALRRAARTAIVMPAMFALGGKVIGVAEIATFAAFGSFAMLMLVDFRGPVRERAQAQAALGLTGAVLVFLGTLASRNIWLAAVAMTLVGFAVIFAGVVSSVLAAATSSLLLAFILPVTLAAPFSVVPARLAGWGMAAVAAVVAVAVLWPAPTREPLRAAAGSACRGLAGRLRSEVVYVLSDHDPTLVPDRDRAVEAADQAVGAVHRVFLATPYRPTGLSTTDRAIVRLVDELSWLNAIVGQSAQPARSAQPAAGSTVNRTVCDVKLAACTVLERAADLLEVTGGDTDDLHAAMTALSEALIRAEQAATDDLPVGRQARPPEPGVLDRR